MVVSLESIMPRNSSEDPIRRALILRDAGSSPVSTTRICTSFAADLIITWSCAGKECRRCRLRWKCCASRWPVPLRPSGCVWSEDGANFSSSSDACRRWRRSAPDTPVFILHLYCRALLNRAALKACGYTKDTPNPPGGEIVRDKAGNPTGMLVARPNATILYSTLAKGPKLPPEYQYNSTRHFMRELNRLGVTSVCDAGGGFQNYPEDYEIIQQLHQRGEMTIRIAYNLFTQKPGGELEDFVRWSKVVKPDQGDDFFRCNGAGEMLVYSAADFENILEPRPDLPEKLESELERVVRFLAENRWPFRVQ